MAMVKDDTAPTGSRPQIFQMGAPRRLPTRSCKAIEMAACADGLRPMDSSRARSAFSSSKGSSPMAAFSASARRGSSAATLSAVSP
jgi:hypothetical protein